jgi:speckle-type POZ protein
MAAAGTKRKLDIAATTRCKEAEEVCFTWRIEGLTPDSFTGAENGAAGWLHSPEFSALGKEWRLRAYLNGDKAEDAGHFSLFLHLRTPNFRKLTLNSTITPHVALSIGDRKLSLTDRVFTTVQPTPEGSGQGWGSSKFLPHTDLLSKRDVYFPGGIMTVTATLKSTQLVVAEKGVARVAEASVLPIPPPSLVLNLASLLSSGEGADVTLRCGAVHISAHSPILCARSPVLRAHLTGPLACSLDNVPVPPEIDEHTLRRTLTFIYTDELAPESAEEAQHLLNAADHYGLPRLRAICENTLAESLSVDNAAFTLTLAEQHGAAALKDAALRFVASNAVAVMATEGWRHLKAASPALVEAAMITAVTGAPPVPAPAPDAAGASAEAVDGEARRVRRRTK